MDAYAIAAAIRDLNARLGANWVGVYHAEDAHGLGEDFYRDGWGPALCPLCHAGNAPEGDGEFLRLAAEAAAERSADLLGE